MKTILHIEDIDSVRKTVRIVLSRAGYDVIEAGSVAEAQALWSAHAAKIDVIITDNALPDGSGVELVKQFEMNRPGLGIIVTSGMPHEGLPANYYQLAKPYSSQFLLCFVRGALKEYEGGIAV